MLFRNAFTIALAIMIGMLALAQIGVKTSRHCSPVPACLVWPSASAPRKFVQDIITGIFIQFENIMNEGDVVEVAGLTGVVERLTIPLRSRSARWTARFTSCRSRRSMQCPT